MADEQSTQVVSHGRGGQGNIAADSTKYVDAEIVREGIEGDQGDGAYSAGRGGIGNIGSPNIPPSRGRPHDVDVIPPSAVRQPSGTDYHVGRGGQGNVCSEPSKVDKVETNKGPEVETDEKPQAAPEGFAERLKQMIFGRK
ncbi:hypothetical protein MferCBS31731_004197 [Microsporum ferrugineum]